MLLRKVVLDNYGLYNGWHEFDLVPREKYRKVRPIVLFGGKNGAGKTTLLNAVRLALYGKNSIGPRLSQKAYHDFLRSHIHRSRGAFIPNSYARVAVEFDFVSGGQKQSYYIERGWTTLHTNSVEETFKVLCNGEILEDIDESHWESFIADIVPERLSQLFFFDGEKIKRMAEDISGNAAAREAIQSLLGLDVVDRLKTDLSVYRSKEAKKLSRTEDAQVIEQLEKAVVGLSADVVDLEGLLVEKEGERNALEDQIANHESKLKELGGEFANQRELQKDIQIKAEVEIEEVKKGLLDEAAGLLPLALCPGVANALVNQLKQEGESRKSEYVATEVKSFSDKFYKALSKEKSKISPEVLERVQALLSETAASSREEADDAQGALLLHDMSDSNSQRIVQWLEDARKQSLPALKKLSKRYESSHRALVKAKASEDRVPEQEVLKPVFEKINELNIRLGSVSNELKQGTENVRRATHEKAERERELQKLESSALDHVSGKARIELAENIKQALDYYYERLTKKKVESLERSVSECFNRLVRKEDTLRKIEINPQSFHVILQDASGNNIPKEELSSGEKQIYAISLLWGLARTSGRPLPVVVDTPLGRLDSDHRKNLIEKYFPHAGHQVILFSTDTEVDQGLFKILSPNVSHCYHLVYDDEKRCTISKEEYFWKESSRA